MGSPDFNNLEQAWDRAGWGDSDILFCLCWIWGMCGHLELIEETARNRRVSLDVGLFQKTDAERQRLITPTIIRTCPDKKLSEISGESVVQHFSLRLPRERQFSKPV
jgi:hypothetical protein